MSLSPAEMMDSIGMHLTVQISKSGEAVGLAEHGWVDQPDGFLGDLGAGRISMELWFDDRVGPQGSVVACTIDNKRHHIPLVNRRPEMNVAPEGEYPVYRRAVSITTSDAGIAYTMFPANLARILRVVPAAGRLSVEIYEVSIISQKGAFFVCFQQTNEVPVFLANDGSLMFPSLEDGPMKDFIQKFVGGFLGGNPTKIPSISEYVGSSRMDGSDLSDGEARVIWFNQAQGYGLVVTRRDGKAIEARIHWSALPERWIQDGRPGRKVVYRGEIISYDEISAPRMGVATGYATPRQTTFQWEVVGHVRVAEGFAVARI